MRFPNVSTTTEKAYELYYKYPYFRGSTIRELFGCGKSTVDRIKKMCRAEMQDRGIKYYCEHNELLSKDVLYELAGLDIKQITRDYRMLKKGG